MASAALSVAAQITRYVILFTGDVSWSGEPQEFEGARVLLQTIKSALKDGAPHASIDIVVIPGNHDCSLTNEPQTRALTLESLRRSDLYPTDDAIQTGLSVQAAFRAFAISCNPPTTDVALNGLRTSHTIDESGWVIRIDAYNSAWSSQLHEEKGGLLFPQPVAPEGEADLSVALIHHPPSWFRWDIARSLQRTLESSANLVFTGHEHIPDSFEIGRRKDKTRFVEGGLLQGEHPGQSTFNIVVVDLEQRKLRVNRARLEGDSYRTNAYDSEWVDLPSRGRFGRKQRFSLVREYQSSLLDLGLPITHSQRSKIELMDLFVPPCLRRAQSRGDSIDKRTVIDSDSVLDELTSQDRALVIGADASGKSALARASAIHALEAGLVPVLLPADQLQPRHVKNIERCLGDAFGEQYGDDLDRYYSLARNERLIIVDDFHLCQLTGDERRLLLDGFAAFGKLLIFGGETLRLEEMVTSPQVVGELLSSRQYEIMPFGHLLRSRLIEKWIDLSGDSSQASSQRAHTLTVIQNQVNAVIGKNLVPSHPSFLLLILQQAEASTPLNTSSGSYGYFYEALITFSLASRSKGIDVDTLYTYLSEFAFLLFTKKKRACLDSEFSELHSRYCEEYQRNLSLPDLISTLTGSELIEHRSEGFFFKYKYTYYYFVARHLRNTPEELSRAVKELVSKLYREEEANIYLFLSYLSRDPIIIGEILKTAQSLFSELPECNFDDHLSFLAQLSGAEGARLELPSRSPQHNRERVYRELDSYEPPDTSEGSGEDPESDIEIVNRLNVAMKTLQILGQAMKNAPGSLKGELKEQIALEVYSLGRRTLSAMLGIVRDFAEKGLPEIVDSILTKKAPDKLGSDERSRATEQAQRILSGLGQMVAVSTLKRISQSVGLEKLDQTYTRLADSRGDIATRLIDACIRLDHYGRIPEDTLFSLEADVSKTLFPKRFLRWLVFERLYMMPCDFRVRQRLCERFEISARGTRSGYPQLLSTNKR